MTGYAHSRRARASCRTLAVSFSGTDGAGKSTQIHHLLACLKGQGLSVRVFRFWDDIASLTSLREGAGHTIFRGDKGVGRPDKPINRRDKNVRGLPMGCLRLVLYFADVISLRQVYRRALRSDIDCVIFDRYIYDELANLELENNAIRVYVRWIMRLAPRPDVSFILDADPVAARNRKPEYPLEFTQRNREAYISLSRLPGSFTIIPPMEVEATKTEVWKRAQSALGQTNLQITERPSLAEQTTRSQLIS